MESWHLPINLSAQIVPDYIVLEFSEFSGRACPWTPQHVSPWALLMGANAPILYLPSICSTKAYKQKMPRNAPDFHNKQKPFSSCQYIDPVPSDVQ